MPNGELNSNQLHDRTLDGLRQVIERALTYVFGVERVVVGRAVQLLHPRVEERIRQASEEDLREEIKYLHELLGSILDEPSPKKSKNSQSKSKRTHRKKKPY